MKKIACCSLVLLLGITSVFAFPSSHFKGIIIDIGNDSIQIKKLGKEITLFLTPNTKVLFHGREVEPRSIDICQTVKAAYVLKNDRKELVTLDILRRSYCTR
jgi:hypothetical protein